MYKKSLCFLLFIIVAISMNVAYIFHLKYIGKAYAHILSSNENAALLAIFYQIQTEAELAQRAYASNVTLAQEHAENTLELLGADWTNSTADKAIVVNDIAPILYTLDHSVKHDQPDSDIEMIVSYLHYAVEKFVDDYVGKSILNNHTIQALALVDITNVVDNKYASAFGTGSGKMPSAVGMSHMMPNMMTNNSALNIKQMAAKTSISSKQRRQHS
jgi:hypothetical protein